MVYNSWLSSILNHPTYILNSGDVIVQFHGLQFFVGTTKSTIKELKTSLSKHI